MTHSDELVERVARAILKGLGCISYKQAPDDWLIPDDEDSAKEMCEQLARAALSALPYHELLREALEVIERMLAHACVADSDPNDKDAEDHDAERRARAVADKIRTSLTQEK